ARGASAVVNVPRNPLVYRCGPWRQSPRRYSWWRNTMGRNRMTGIAVAGVVASTILAACTASISWSSPSAATSLQPQRELLPDQQVQQVLARFAFGGRPGDAARVRAMGVDRWMELQLHPERIDDRAADRVMASFDMLHVPTSEVLESYRELREARRRAQRASPGAVNPRSRSADDPNGVRRRPALRDAVLGDARAREAARRVRAVAAQVQAAKLARAVTSERQLQE